MKDPKYLFHIPGEQGGAQMVRICSGADLPKADKSKFYMLRVFGNQAHEMWDVTNAAKAAASTGAHPAPPLAIAEPMAVFEAPRGG